MVIPNNYQELLWATLGIISCLIFSLSSMYFLFDYFSCLCEKEREQQGIAATYELGSVARVKGLTFQAERIDGKGYEPLSLSADCAEFFQQEKKIVMYGRVLMVYHDVTIEGASLIGDAKKGLLYSSEPVLVTHAYGKQHAGSFCLTASDEKISFGAPVCVEVMVPELQQDQ